MSDPVGTEARLAVPPDPCAGVEAEALAAGNLAEAAHGAARALAAEVDRLRGECDQLRAILALREAEVLDLLCERRAYEHAMIGRLAGPAAATSPDRPWQVWSLRHAGRFRSERDARRWLRGALGLDDEGEPS